MNFGASSSWIKNLYTAAQWRAVYPDVPHWLFKFSYLTNLNIEPDELHVLHLGTSMWFVGSLLWLIVFQLLPGTHLENVQDVWSRIVRAYSIFQPPTQYTNIRMSSFCNPCKPAAHYPKLKGKGAEVKGLIAPLAHVWEGLMDNSNYDHLRIQACLMNIVRIQNIIDDHAEC